MADLRLAGVSDAAVDAYLARIADVGEEYAQSVLAVEQMFRGPAMHVRALREASGSAAATWLFDFAYRSPVTGTAAHCQDIPFAFDLLDASGVNEQFGANPPQALADAMHAAWVRFITTGAVDWPSVESHASGAQVFDVSSAYDPGDYRFDSEVAGV
ncbi:hypothetical protein AX769_17025 [Frondihabitans sp. PAMC 28766]|uniref:carboxylesterase family protein n=1 Tax=Frondihabitans sp. PAMC 28766 TaxID=1795630 RepID=UPI00078E2F24|nr:carboxylesterase family protein [Frondihabitans sp. PAMC 28766]AMM21533.1 hypothetical protein AX769_17025 [Frondihabitans sp. PAMC 28766]